MLCFLDKPLEDIINPITFVLWLASGLLVGLEHMPLDLSISRPYQKTTGSSQISLSMVHTCLSYPLFFPHPSHQPLKYLLDLRDLLAVSGNILLGLLWLLVALVLFCAASRFSR